MVLSITTNQTHKVYEKLISAFGADYTIEYIGYHTKGSSDFSLLPKYMTYGLCLEDLLKLDINPCDIKIR